MVMLPITRRACCGFLGWVLAWTCGVVAADDATRLQDQLSPLLDCVLGERDAFSVRTDIEVEIDGRPQAVQAHLTRYDDDQFDLRLHHQDYAAEIYRRHDKTALVLPKHQRAFVGSGRVDEDDHLQPLAITQRFVGSGTTIFNYTSLLRPGNHPAVCAMLVHGLGLSDDADAKLWQGKDLRIQFDSEGRQIELQAGTTRAKLVLEAVGKRRPIEPPDSYEIVNVERAELERTLVRGTRRALEILAPSRALIAPRERPRSVPGGELRYVDGQRLVLLHGTPEEIGRAHGKLLHREAQRCIDSVLYTFGTVQTIRTGRWFRQDLEAAFKRLKPHIPADHLAEMRSLASAMQWDPHLLETVNVFPELFHCSGFAVFDSATADGTLYHGRVLDYMTTIGLQDAATTFVIAVDGKIPFANVGYAGFIGSVTGMNAEAISLGEMGGGGEGQWDGVPMATLMRRALEECSTLDEVKQLWTENPRTCEYYYVFADGKTNQAVGVAAVPEKVEFIAPGQADPRLGKGIPDAVVLSAGERLQTLRQRVLKNHGRIDAEAAIGLMNRPVAMQSNLHNALFVPAKRILYVANATHDQPAAQCKYVRYDLQELLDSIKP